MTVHRALFAVLLLVAACSKGDKSSASKDDGKVASCNMPSLQSCREYRGGNLALGTENLAKLCEIGNFKLTETPCPTENIIGVCAMNEGTDYFYGGYGIPVGEIESTCTSRGHKFRAK
jgi:hypothetical protein